MRNPITSQDIQLDGRNTIESNGRHDLVGGRCVTSARRNGHRHVTTSQCDQFLTIGQDGGGEDTGNDVIGKNVVQLRGIVLEFRQSFIGHGGKGSVVGCQYRIDTILNGTRQCRIEFQQCLQRRPVIVGVSQAEEIDSGETGYQNRVNLIEDSIRCEQIGLYDLGGRIGLGTGHLNGTLLQGLDGHLFSVEHIQHHTIGKIGRQETILTGGEGHMKGQEVQQVSRPGGR